MAVYRTKIMAAALKVQTAEGTAATPGVATDGVRIAGAPPMLTLEWTEDGDRSGVTDGNMGSAGRAVPVGAVGSIDLPMELHGKGTAYTSVTEAPSNALDAALRIAGLVKAYAAGELSYTDAEASLEVGTLYLYTGTQLWIQLKDCVATMRVNLTANKPGLVTFGVKGTLAAAIQQAAFAGLVLPTTMPAPWTGATLTALGTWSTATTAPNQLRARSATVTMNEERTERPYAGADGVAGRVITDRMPELALETEAVALTAFNPYTEAGLAKSTADTSPRFTTTIPGGTGNTVRLDTGVVALRLPQDRDDGGLLGWTLGGRIVKKTLADGTGAVRLAFT